MVSTLGVIAGDSVIAERECGSSHAPGKMFLQFVPTVALGDEVHPLTCLTPSEQTARWRPSGRSGRGTKSSRPRTLSSLRPLRSDAVHRRALAFHDAGRCSRRALFHPPRQGADAPCARAQLIGQTDCRGCTGKALLRTVFQSATRMAERGVQRQPPRAAVATILIF